jgi:AhpD family alkylhydroperoxidase
MNRTLVFFLFTLFSLAAAPRVPLAPGDQDPNFVRALHLLPGAAQPMRGLFDAVVYQGSIAPETKLAMGLRIARFYGSSYLTSQMRRRLQSTPAGRAFLSASPAAPPAALALTYAEKLTRDIHGVDDTSFQLLRSQYNDSQLVELTIATCFFNYLVRFAEAFALPVEGDSPIAAPSRAEAPIARVALISDPEINAVKAIEQRNREQPSPLGIGFANSMRAMLRSPAAASAWLAYGAAVRSFASVDRTLKLHVSFAVSTANGCRYCTLHQVQGLRRQGVSIAKLVAMKKDDSALSPRELTAVRFARKLTAAPASLTAADYAALKQEFGEQGAMEIALQTCTFAYMNRFTDGLRLPSEDEAVQTYKEVYSNR